jgi:hypothetical protein
MAVLIKETVEDVNLIVEELLNEDGTKKKNYFIEGVWIMTEQPNRNNRIYKFPHMNRVVENYRRDYIDQNRAFGELGHPDTPSINLDRVSHMITKLDAQGNNFFGKAKILDTPTGNTVKGLLDGGAKLGVSTRGVGSLKPHQGYQLVQDDFQMATAGDIVANPSAQIAFVNAILENKEWIFENGNWHEVQVARAKKAIKFAPKHNREAVFGKLFEDFISKL